MIGFEELRRMQGEVVQANQGGVDTDLIAMGVDPLGARKYAESILHVIAQHRMKPSEAVPMVFLAGLTLGYRVRERETL